MSNELVVSKNERISSTAMIMHEGNLDRIKAFSSLMSGSNMVPEHFKGNSYDCAIVVAKALSMGMDPVAMSQEVFPVKGKMTYGSKLIIAMIHSCGMVEPRTFIKTVGDWTKKGRLINGRFQNEEGLGVQVGFKFIGDEQPTWGSVLMMTDQSKRNSPLWQTDPQQQMTYLAAKRWSSIHLPGVTMGMTLAEEMQDLPQQSATPTAQEKDITPTNNQPAVDFNDCQDAEIVVKKEEVKEVVIEEKPVKEKTFKEVKAEAQESIKKIMTPEPETKPETKPEPEKAAPKNGDLSPLGVPFDDRYMTGSILANGEFRLSKKGKEHFAKEHEKIKEQIKEVDAKIEAAKEKEALNEVQKQVDIKKEWAKPLTEEVANFYGGYGPFEIKSIDQAGRGEIVLVGFEENIMPLLEDDLTPFFEFVPAPTVKKVEETELTQEVKDALKTSREQIKICDTRLKENMIKLNIQPSATDLLKLKEMHDSCVLTFNTLTKNKAALTKEVFAKVRASNEKYWNDAKAFIAKIQIAKMQMDENDPFAE